MPELRPLLTPMRVSCVCWALTRPREAEPQPLCGGRFKGPQACTPVVQPGSGDSPVALPDLGICPTPTPGGAGLGQGGLRCAVNGCVLTVAGHLGGSAGPVPV